MCAEFFSKMCVVLRNINIYLGETNITLFFAVKPAFRKSVDIW